MSHSIKSIKTRVEIMMLILFGDKSHGILINIAVINFIFYLPMHHWENIVNTILRNQKQANSNLMEVLQTQQFVTEDDNLPRASFHCKDLGQESFENLAPKALVGNDFDKNPEIQNTQSTKEKPFISKKKSNLNKQNKRFYSEVSDRHLRSPKMSKSKPLRTQPKQTYQQSIRQLKFIYERKNKLHYKLQKLNDQLSRLHNSPDQTEFKLAPILHQKKYNKKIISQNIDYPYFRSNPQSRNLKKTYNPDTPINNSSLKINEDELMKSKRAIQFIQKMSRDSFERRINHQMILNKNMESQLASRIKLNCSRLKCRKEVIN